MRRWSPPATLTDEEQEALLQSTSTVALWRDHVIIRLALQAGLREHEIAALDVRDVVADVELRSVRPWVTLRTFKRSRRRRRETQSAHLPGTLRAAIERWLLDLGPTDTAAPLFPSRQRDRISSRQIRRAFAAAQERAGFERRYRFHDLRHTFASAIYRATRDLVAVQRLARHARPETSAIYTHMTPAELAQASELATRGRHGSLRPVPRTLRKAPGVR